MRRNAIWSAVSIAPVLVAWGCGSQSTTTTSNTPTAPSGATSASPEPAAPAARSVEPLPEVEETPDGAVALRDATHEDFRALLEQHHGKFVFVDYWATWCGNCMEEFPHTVELAKKYPDRLVVISVAMELDPTDAGTRQAVLDFLTKQGAAFDNLLYTADGTTEEAMAGFQIDAGSALPYFQLYDRDGKLLQSFTYSDPRHPIAREDIDAAVEAALAGR